MRHLQAKGATPGWQVAVEEIEFFGDVELDAGSTLSTLSQSFTARMRGIGEFGRDFYDLRDRKVSVLMNATKSVFRTSMTSTGTIMKESVSLKSRPDVLVCTRCTGADGYMGILDVNHGPALTSVERGRR